MAEERVAGFQDAEVKNWLQIRQNLYRLQSHLLAEPISPQLLRELAEGALFQLLAEEAEGDLKQGWTQLSSYCRELQKGTRSLDKAAAELRAEYNRLFVGPGHLEAPPWESVYRSADHLLFGEETLQVRRAYEEFGLVTKKLHQEPDDHIALELEFMERLCGMAMEAGEKGEDPYRYLQAQKRFLEEHLLEWVPAWAEDVGRAAATGFFQGLALSTRAFLQEDYQELCSFLKQSG
ncbi:MAG: molecular chaperone TorD family protein [Clostridia bacterium]|nr:molecular chaperone TorD family protein [Clostridia bacterium]